MRKYLSFAFIILIVPFIFPMFVKADDDSATVIANIKSYYEAEFNQTYNINSSTTWNSFYQYWKEHPTYRGCIFDYQVINQHSLYANIGMNNYLLNGQPYTNGDFREVDLCSTYVSSSTGAYRIATHDNVWKFYNSFDEFEQSLGLGIDFETIYYSPQIPIPNIDVFMDSNNNYPTAGEAVWNASVELEDNSDYYIQWGIKISYPSYITVGLGSLNGNFLYNYYSYLSGSYSDVVTMESLTPAIAQGGSASSFQSGWETTYSVLANQPPEFEKAVNAMNDTMLNNAKQYYIDYMMTQMPMYGNRLEIFARYFIIDSENNNRVVVGAWNHWSSKDGSKTKERPSNYIDNVALPGYINSSSDTNLQNNNDTFDSVGSSTGVPSTVINNNYVPNYPDYPTISSYNKDNLLVGTIEKMGEIKGFFGEFNDFLAVTFVWVPDWIWGLIGIGFGLSIIVFFLRML